LNEHNKSEELKLLRKAAEDGNPEAQGQLGTLLALGEVVPQDLDEALKWLKNAAELGDLTAMFNLGIIYEQGLGVPCDLEEAGLWFWKAAEHGDTGAKMKLGTMLLRKTGFSPGSRVLDAIRSSAEEEFPYAQTFLGKIYMDGVGLEQDDAKAEYWFRKAVRQGDEGAMFNLGEMAAIARTTETTEDEVAQWFYEFGMTCLKNRNVVKAFDCLVSIKRVVPEHFLSQRLEAEIDRENQTKPGRE